jgi:drug/metabolite transporter (DMT)-like permease
MDFRTALALLLAALAAGFAIYANIRVWRSKKATFDTAFEFLWPQILSAALLFLATLIVPESASRPAAVVMVVFLVGMIVAWWKVFDKFKKPRVSEREIHSQQELEEEEENADEQ